MSNRKPCFLAGVCCLFYTVVFAQPEWPIHQTVKDTSTSNQQPYEELNNDAPLIYYQDRPSALVFIDGDPVITVDEELRMYRILNTPHLIIKNHHDNRYYLYWGKYWYVSDSATYGYGYLKTYPEVIKLIDSIIKLQEKPLVKLKGVVKPRTIAPPLSFKPLSRPQIVITTEPAELIWTKGEPVYKTVPGTSIQYATNTNDNIFKDTILLKYYILISGRWYRSDSLRGAWTYTPPNRLPSDFKLIPAGSEKASVLIHISGTDSSRRAVEEAKMINITRVNRHTTKANVVYDGGAEFSSISNTGLFVSENSNIPVINVKDKYYALQDGIWFISNEAIGSPWEVSTERPPDIDKIPPTHRIYNTRYVYIYDTTADYVSTGYSAGYTNSYIQENTIVYGTGWPYKSWCRRSYYPRPDTWGYGMKYSSEKGWMRKNDLILYKCSQPLR